MMGTAQAFLDPGVWAEFGTQGVGTKAQLAQVPKHLSPPPPASLLYGIDAGESWCSLRVTDGPCVQEEAVGYESRFDGTVLPEGGVNL